MRRWVRRMVWVLAAAAVVACSSGTTGTGNGAIADAGTQDIAASSADAGLDGVGRQPDAAPQPEDIAQRRTGDVAPTPLPTSGNAVAPGKGLPEMTQVVDSNNQAVGHDDLLGQWTVMWFYPAAQTSG